MSELGRLLAEARAARGLSLADVESVTRIRQKWLEALETGDFSRLPRGAVARGFLRTYAAYLSLDAQAMLSRYTTESGDAGDVVAIAEPGQPRLVDYRPLEVELLDDHPDNGWVRWLAALLVVAALAGGAWWFLSRNPGWNPFAALAPAAQPTATNTSTPWVVTATPRATITLPVAEALATSDILPLPTPTVPASPTLTPRPSATPEFVASITLEVRATQRSWLRVMVDGAIAEEGFLEANDTRVWEANDAITVRTGNGGGVTLLLNGEDLGAMGTVGQVIERSWVVVDTGEVQETGPTTPAAETPPPSPTPSMTPAG